MDAVGVVNNNFKEGVTATIADAKANKLRKVMLLLAAQLLIIEIVRLRVLCIA